MLVTFSAGWKHCDQNLLVLKPSEHCLELAGNHHDTVSLKGELRNPRPTLLPASDVSWTPKTIGNLLKKLYCICDFRNGNKHTVYCYILQKQKLVCVYHKQLTIL